MRWSAQSCGLGRVGTPVQLEIVSLCRRDRRHGKPGGLLHGEAGMASLAACSTRSAGVASKAACCKGRRRDRLQERHSVKGAEAGGKAGRRLESLPHIGHDMEGTEKANLSAA